MATQKAPRLIWVRVFVILACIPTAMALALYVITQSLWQLTPASSGLHEAVIYWLFIDWAESGVFAINILTTGVLITFFGALCLLFILLKQYFRHFQVFDYLFVVVDLSVMIIIVLTMLGPAVGADRRHHLQSISAGEHVYYLTLRQQLLIGHGQSCRHSYMVFECDEGGWVCHQLYESLEIPKIESCNNKLPGSLMVDMSIRKLQLVENGEILFSYVSAQ